MPVSFVDQLMASVSVPANMTAFIDSVGLSAYAALSFTRRYGQGGFEVDSVGLGAPSDFELQLLVVDDARITGTEQGTHSGGVRKLFDLRYRRQQPIGWVDAAFTVGADFNAHVVPGSALLGPAANVESGGVSFGPPASTIQSKFLLALTTDTFTLSYPLRVYVFASADLSPTDDLRRIRQVRKFLEADPAFLASLDGPPDQRPLLFVQIYPGNAANDADVDAAAVARIFDTDDILAAFFSPPA